MYITNGKMSAVALPAVIAAADHDLYRVAGSLGIPPVFRTRDGEPIDTRAVLVALAGGLMGEFHRETLPDGVLADRLDLSEGGLDWYLAQTNA